MKIDILSETTLKLTLTEADMKESRICYEALSKQNTDCRKVLERLIEKGASPETAAMAAELLEEESRLLVEAFPSANGGCMVYLSALNRSRPKRKRSSENSHSAKPAADERHCSDQGSQLLDRQTEASPIIFETASGETLGKLCSHLEAERRSGMRFSSKLFSNDHCYRLALIPLNTCAGRLTRILREYGTVTNSELIAAYTQEHFGELIGENASELCQKFF
ncbi:MAG: adaptor protein MecA [Ruminiclostridium sp.]|nr:adaptor protein MecA [Ruminiclostridium sp.]